MSDDHEELAERLKSVMPHEGDRVCMNISGKEIRRMFQPDPPVSLFTRIAYAAEGREQPPDPLSTSQKFANWCREHGFEAQENPMHDEVKITRYFREKP